MPSLGISCRESRGPSCLGTETVGKAMCAGARPSLWSSVLFPRVRGVPSQNGAWCTPILRGHLRVTKHLSLSYSVTFSEFGDLLQAAPLFSDKGICLAFTPCLALQFQVVDVRVLCAFV